MRVLVLAPHTDDGELGCGGTIHRLCKRSHRVHYIAFSAAGVDALREEVVEATGVLGLPESRLKILNFAVRSFPAKRQEILEVMVALQKELQPDLVFMPSIVDTHQDHQTVSAEGFRAFKRTTILGYELPWNNMTFATTAFMPLEPEDVRRKADALACYKSQAGKPYANESYVRSLAGVRGVQVGCQYAEAFEVIRWVMKL